MRVPIVLLYMCVYILFKGKHSPHETLATGESDSTGQGTLATSQTQSDIPAETEGLNTHKQDSVELPFTVGPDKSEAEGLDTDKDDSEVQLPLPAQLVINISNTFQGFISQTVYIVETLVTISCYTTIFLIDFVFGAIDVVLRGPIYVVKLFSEVIVLVMDIFLYLTGEFKMLSLDSIFRFCVMSVLYMTMAVLQTTHVTAVSIIALVSGSIVWYLLGIDWMVTQITYPAADAMFQMGSLILVMAALIHLVTGAVHSARGRARSRKYRYKCFALIPVLIAGYDLWRTINATILAYVIYPLVYILTFLAFTLFMFIIFSFLCGLLPVFTTLWRRYILHVEWLVSTYWRRIRTFCRLKVQYFYELISATGPSVDVDDNEDNLDEWEIAKDVSEWGFLEACECVVCFETIDQTVKIIPCGHTSVCKSCVKRIRRLDRRCPLCRQSISTIIVEH